MVKKTHQSNRQLGTSDQPVSALHGRKVFIESANILRLDALFFLSIYRSYILRVHVYMKFVRLVLGSHYIPNLYFIVTQIRYLAVFQIYYYQQEKVPKFHFGV